MSAVSFSSISSATGILGPLLIVFWFVALLGSVEVMSQVPYDAEESSIKDAGFHDGQEILDGFHFGGSLRGGFEHENYHGAVEEFYDELSNENWHQEEELYNENTEEELYNENAEGIKKPNHVYYGPEYDFETKQNYSNSDYDYTPDPSYDFPTEYTPGAHVDYRHGEYQKTYPLLKPLLDRLHIPPRNGDYYPTPTTPVDKPSICCQDCEDGDIFCFAKCIKVGCIAKDICTAAGKGAYAGFCKKQCEISGFSLRSVELTAFPEEACRGVCAGDVQKMCQSHSCKDFGCYVEDCLDRAPAKCG